MGFGRFFQTRHGATETSSPKKQETIWTIHGRGRSLIDPFIIRFGPHRIGMSGHVTLYLAVGICRNLDGQDQLQWFQSR